MDRLPPNMGEVWIESDSTGALMIFKNSTLVPVLLHNWWHNACNLGSQVISSHIYGEGNGCADMLASIGHFVQDSVWLSELPPALHFHFFRDKHGVPTYISLICCFSLLSFLFEGFGLVAPSCSIFLFFLINFWDWRHMMDVLRGANLVRMM